MSLCYNKTFLPIVEPNSTAPSVVPSPMSSSNRHVTLQAHPASYTMDTGFSWGLKRSWRGANHPPSCSTEIVNGLKIYLCACIGMSWSDLYLYWPTPELYVQEHWLHYKLPSNWTSNWRTFILDFCIVFSGTTSYFLQDSALDPQYMM